jgi:ABC-2 type transport system permease protein
METMLNLILYELRLRRRAILGWAVGITAFMSIYILVYPQMADQMDAFDLESIQLYQAIGMGDLSSFNSYFGSIILNLLAPMLTSIFAVILSTQSLAGEEGDGTLELLAALPLKRWQILTSKAIAVVLATLLLFLVNAGLVTLMFTSIKDQIDGNIETWTVFLALFNIFPLALFFLAFGFLLSTLFPHRTAAVWTAAAVVLAGFFGNNLLPTIESLEFLNNLNPFHYYEIMNLVDRTVEAGGTLVLLGAGLGVYLLAVLLFNRRKLLTGLPFWA